jgi:hypothetical protein
LKEKPDETEKSKETKWSVHFWKNKWERERERNRDRHRHVYVIIMSFISQVEFATSWIKAKCHFDYSIVVFLCRSDNIKTSRGISMVGLSDCSVNWSEKDVDFLITNFTNI